MKGLVIQGPVKEVKKIIEHICKDNKGLTLEKYIKKFDKDLVILN